MKYEKAGVATLIAVVVLSAVPVVAQVDLTGMWGQLMHSDSPDRGAGNRRCRGPDRREKAAAAAKRAHGERRAASDARGEPVSRRSRLSFGEDEGSSPGRRPWPPDEGRRR